MACLAKQSFLYTIGAAPAFWQLHWLPGPIEQGWKIQIGTHDGRNAGKLAVAKTRLPAKPDAIWISWIAAFPAVISWTEPAVFCMHGTRWEPQGRCCLLSPQGKQRYVMSSDVVEKSRWKARAGCKPVDGFTQTFQTAQAESPNTLPNKPTHPPIWGSRLPTVMSRHQKLAGR